MAMRGSMVITVLTLAALSGSVAARAKTTAAATPAPVVILHQDVPLYDVYAWERWGNFINAEAGSKTEIPYDAAHLKVKVYTFPSGEIRAIRFMNGVRTHRHVNQTDTVLYGWQANRVQYVDDKAVVAGPGDFALHQKGVLHSGEEIRRGGGIDLEFAVTISGRHNDPTGYWSMARDHPVQPAASWRANGRDVEAVGAAAAGAPAGAARYRVRIADLPDYPAREVHLTGGTAVPSRDPDRDRLIFVLSGRLRATIAGTSYVLAPEDAARFPRGAEVRIEAEGDSLYVQTSVPAK